MNAQRSQRDLIADTPPARGYVIGLVTYLLWGFLPVYMKLLDSVSPLEVTFHRIIWAVPFLLLTLALLGKLGNIATLLRNPAALRALGISALLISGNWLINTYAIFENHLMASSLGYFLTPLVNVLLGIVILKEKLRPMQAVAIACAAIAVTIIATTALDTLWIAISLAGCFGVYGLVRKMAPAEAIEGLTVEAMLMFVPSLAALGWMSAHGRMSFGQGADVTALLVGAGVVMTVPLIFFGFAVRMIPLVSIGLLQFIAPTIQFLLAWLVYHEPLTWPLVISFTLIWAGLALFSMDLVHLAHRQRRVRATQ